MPSTPQVTQTVSDIPTGMETAATAAVITAALQTAANVVVITDANGIILWINSAFTNRRKDGSLYQDEHTITLVFSKEGVITHIIAIMDNVTERRP
jgi:hypothetical protein